MKKAKENSGDLLDVMVDWQDTETGAIIHTKDQIPKAKNPLTKTMLKVIRLEAEKNSLIQQMIVESVKKEFLLIPQARNGFNRQKLLCGCLFKIENDMLRVSQIICFDYRHCP